jgi:opacity protein-like surface antigen
MLAPGTGRWAVIASVCAYAVSSFSAGPARADDVPVDWGGLYVGAQLGGAIDDATVANPYGASIFGDDIKSSGAFIGLKGGYNYQFGRGVAGLEADANWAGMQGTFTCLQTAHGVPGFPASYRGGAFGATCEVAPDWFGTVVARGGYALGPQGRLLLFGKGGLAWMHTDVDIGTNNSVQNAYGPRNARSSSSVTKLGWTLGGGLEYAATRNWSIGFEYDYMQFGGGGIATPDARPVLNPAFPGIAGTAISTGAEASLSQDVHAVKIALNYHLGDGLGDVADEAYMPSTGALPASVTGYQSEAGIRYVYAWSKFQQDLGNPPFGLPVNNSRLTWNDMGTSGTELFWRFDTPQNIVLKGFAGLGYGNTGHINDEDWGIPNDDIAPTKITPYQNTLSEATSKIGYFTLDLGYDVLRAPTYKVTPFFGYNFFHYRMTAFNCTFVMEVPNRPCNANDPPGQIFLQEKDNWISWRLGTGAEVMLTPRLKLTGDAAYLPFVRYRGRDDHPLRAGEGTSTFSPAHGRGSGVQLEGIAAYDITDAWSVGVGGRYWYMAVPSGTTNFFSEGKFQNERFATELTAVFVQGSYKFGAPD